MVDWPGLLKWTLANTDGTQTKPDIKPMDPETKKWLEEALESYSLDEAKRMREIIENLIKPETKDDPKEEERKVVLLDEIAELVEGLENARDLVRMGIYEPIVHLMFNSVYPEVRKNAYYVFASCNSNNTLVQQTSVELGALKLVNSVMQESNVANKEAAFAALSSLVRGECLEIKRTFIDIEGIEFLLELLSNDQVCSSNKIRTKAMTLLYDLTFYDDKLDYKDIATYNNASGNQEKKVNDKSSKLISLKKEEKKEEEKTETENKEPVGSSGEVQDLSGYKNIVKKKLIQKGFFDLHSRYLGKENPKTLMDLRPAYFGVCLSLIQFDPSCVPSKEYFNKIAEFETYIKEENKKHEGMFQQELDLIKQLTALQK